MTTPPEPSLVKDHLDDLSGLLDRDTAATFARIGLDKGWHCWSAFGGNGSIATLMYEMTGSDGHVVVTDTTLDYLSVPDEVDAFRRDIVHAPPGEDFDLIHCRALWQFEQRDEILAAMTPALRPGGVIVLESADGGGGYESPVLLSPRDDVDDLNTFDDVHSALRVVLESFGFNFDWHAEQHARLLALGLERITTQALSRSWPGCSVATRAMSHSIHRLLPELLAMKHLSTEAVEIVQRLLDEPSTVISSPTIWTTVGYRSLST